MRLPHKRFLLYWVLFHLQLLRTFILCHVDVMIPHPLPMMLCHLGAYVPHKHGSHPWTRCLKLKCHPCPCLSIFFISALNDFWFIISWVYLVGNLYYLHSNRWTTPNMVYNGHFYKGKPALASCFLSPFSTLWKRRMEHRNRIEGAVGCPSWDRPLCPLFYFLCSIFLIHRVLFL